jgi:hypothetical protein
MANSGVRPAGNAEAQGFVLITFHIERRNGSFSEHNADCLTFSVISGIKEDFQAELGPPETQRWYYNDTKMEDNQRLIDYGIDGTEEIAIVVKTSNN